VEFAFDPAKDAVNRRKHRISLRRAEDFDYDAAFFRVDDRKDYGEIRFRALGFLDGRLFRLVFTQRGDVIRSISLRKANKAEEKEYDQEQG